jgi:hypothetical protein
MSQDDITFSLNFSAQPAIVGYLDIVPGFSIAARARPSRLHRFAMRVVFGWKWRDAYVMAPVRSGYDTSDQAQARYFSDPPP